VRVIMIVLIVKELQMVMLIWMNVVYAIVIDLMIVPLEHVIALSLALFSIGVLGVLLRRNAITIFMSIELMLNAVNLALVGFSRYYDSVDGQVFVFLVMALAAAEVAVGLAIIIALYRNRQTVNIDEINLMKN